MDNNEAFLQNGVRTGDVLEFQIAIDDQANPCEMSLTSFDDHLSNSWPEQASGGSRPRRDRSLASAVSSGFRGTTAKPAVARIGGGGFAHGKEETKERDEKAQSSWDDTGWHVGFCFWKMGKICGRSRYWSMSDDSNSLWKVKSIANCVGIREWSWRYNALLNKYNEIPFFSMICSVEWVLQHATVRN